MIDRVLDMYKGKITYTELMGMDMPMMRAMSRSAIERIAENRKAQSGELEDLIKEHT